MKVLLSWLADFVDVPVRPAQLADRLMMLGLEVASVVEVAEGPLPPGVERAASADAVIDLEITANRPDCLGLIGIAREVSTAFDVPLRLPGRGQAAALLEGERLERGEDAALDVVLEEPGLCPRYSAAIADVQMGPSPAWLTRRLELSDIRPISNVVDVTNYVLMEIGQPMHAFDLSRLDGGQLRIRRARAGESITALDGVHRQLDAGMLVIADRSRPQAIAGVMGGRASEVGSATRVIVLESACFEPTSVRRTSKKLSLKTEASARFERGADIATPVLGLDRAAALLRLIGAGRARGTAIDRYPDIREERVLPLRRERIARLLGQVVADAEVERMLPGLGFELTPSADGWRVKVPTARVDVLREADLIEEVGRHHGFDRLPPAFPALDEAPAPPDVRIGRDHLVRRVLTAAGFSEAITFAFTEQAAAEAFAPGEEGSDLVPLDNPLSAKFAVLRRSLLPGLIDSLVHNRNRERRDVRLFEIGHCFSATHGEVRKVGFVWTGAASPPHWSGTGREVDFFDARGVIERLSEALGVTIRFEPATCPYLVPGQSAAVRMVENGSETSDIGLLGCLTGVTGELRGLPRSERVFAAELDLDAAWYARVRETGGKHQEGLKPLPRFPSIVRDLSILVADTLPAEKLRGTMRATAPDTLEDIHEFDRYTGQGIPQGRVSVSYRLTFRAADRTLTDGEVQRAVDEIVAALAAGHGAVQR